MILRQQELVIREALDRDVDILCNWWNDGKVMEHAGFPNGLGTTQDEVLKIIQQSTINNRLFILECDNEPIGEINYRRIPDNIAEIGIKICEIRKQEKGYGTRALNLFIGYLFNELKFSKIVLDTNDANKRAQYVYEKIGFRKVRVNKDAWKNQLGVLQSSVDYEMTIDDYNILNE